MGSFVTSKMCIFYILMFSLEVGRKEFADQSNPEEENHEAALEQEISKCKMKIAVKSETLNISLKTFSQAFVEDSAKFSWKR